MQVGLNAVNPLEEQPIICLRNLPSPSAAVNSKPKAIKSSSDDIQDIVRESFDVVGRSTGPIVDCRLNDAYDDYPYEMS